jgi:dTDP-4-amino-4,6-dideoxygalactose transaminase
VRLLARSKEAYHIYHQYVICVPRRDELRAYLTSKKIGSEIYYPVPLHLQQCFAYLGYGTGDLPVTERAAQTVLALPMYPELTPEEQAHVVNAIAEFYS